MGTPGGVGGYRTRGGGTNFGPFAGLDNPDWLIGEKIRKNGVPLRYMDDPKKDGHSTSCWTSTVGSLNVHLSSGVANHALFLMTVGSGRHTVNGVAYNSPTCGGAAAVTGIGNAATTFKGARTATLSAATDLFGTNGTRYRSVAAAWTAVNVK